MRTARCRKNTTTVLEAERKTASQFFIGFLDQDTGRCTTLRLDWQNAATALEAVQMLVGLNPGKKTVVVRDNAPWHRNRPIRAEPAKGNTLHNVHLVDFPPCAPDRNPAGQPRNDTRNASGNIQRDGFEPTLAAFEAHTRSRIFGHRT